MKSILHLALLFLICFTYNAKGVDPEIKTVEGIPDEGFYSEAYQLIFFAVVEGCYRDGLTEADIDHILARDEKGHIDRNQNFVVACLSCAAAFDGFNLYSERQALSRQKKKRKDSSGIFKTFGRGLAPEISEELAKGGQERRDALQKLIQKWVDARFEMMRLDEAETKALRDELATMREEGEKLLKRFKNGDHGEELKKAYANWGDGCPNCEGASPSMGVK